MNTITLPVEARYKLTAEAMNMSGKLVRDSVLPMWVRIALPVALGLQMIVQLPKLQMGGASVGAMFAVVALPCAILLGLWWLNKRRAKRTVLILAGQEIAVKFLEDSFEFSIAGKTEVVGYRRITRAGRDERGLALFIPNVGGIGIPTSAFSSNTHRDYVFEHLRMKLKK